MLEEEAGADRAHWSRVASDWIAWARAPNHDAFWAYRDALAAFVGTGPGEALDVGCGEGRVGRLLRSRGYRVTAADPVAEFIAAGRAAGSGDRYDVAPADALPYPADSFDLVVAYNVLMDIEDVGSAVAEMARVLRPGGSLLVSIVHPIADFGTGIPYFVPRRFDAVEERGGLRMRFAGWTRPLRYYTAALRSAGFAITEVEEPVPDCGEGRLHMRRWTTLPLFLWLRCERRS